MEILAYLENVFLVLHYFVCIFLVIVILLQAGKGAEMGISFGGSSQTVFGSRGASTFLNKLTTGVALVFFLTSVSLSSISRHKSQSSVIQKGSTPAVQSSPGPVASPQATSAPATPAASPLAVTPPPSSPVASPAVPAGNPGTPSASSPLPSPPTPTEQPAPTP